MISKKILRKVGQTNAKYKMFKEGDRILLGLSGGKDSLLLAHILKHFQSVSPYKWSFKAVTLSYGIGEDFSFLIEHCKEHGIAHEIIESKIYEISKEKARENSSVCSLCSRLRRGFLYSYALENGFNKLAIGHHLDDAAESFFMNFIYNGALRTLAPTYLSSRDVEIIRPLILVRERQIIEWAKKNNLKLMSEEFCPAKKLPNKNPHARNSAKELLKSLEANNPNLFKSLEAAFNNIHLDTFFKVPEA